MNREVEVTLDLNIKKYIQTLKSNFCEVPTYDIEIKCSRSTLRPPWFNSKGIESLLQIPISNTYICSTRGREFKEFKSQLKSAKTRFKLSACLNLETFDTILSGTNHI